MSNQQTIVPRRILLTMFGSFGDVHPYMAIAMELQRRGHHPVIATSELYREKMVAAGFDFIPVRPNIPPPQEQDAEMMEKVMHPRSGSQFLLHEMLFPQLRDGYFDLLEVAKGADLLVTHPITFAGPLVAQKTGIPWISTVLAPASLFSVYDPPRPPFWQWLRHLSLLGPRFMTLFLNNAKRVYKSETYEQFRKELNLPDRGSPLFEGSHSPNLVLALFSKIFAQPQADWPPQARATGFAFYDGKNELKMPDELWQFLDEGEPPIVFTLGTSAVWVARNFYRESIAAAQLLKRRAVLLIGDERNKIVEGLPAGIIAVDYAPFDLLLERSCAVVHHGGVGTTAQALRAGVPTLIVPFAFDQPDNAAHAERLGTSRTLHSSKYKRENATRELDKLLNNPQYALNAQKVREQLRKENGAANACDAIQGYLDKLPPLPLGKQDLIYASSN
jgi:MGT family glycosyltransferase